MRILFLDFDGVLNTVAWAEACRRQRSPAHQYLFPRMIARVGYIVESTGAKVVATTNWRMEYSREALETFLRQAGGTFPLLSTTPILPKLRGLEVRAWLDASQEPVEAFAILDDLPRDDFDEFGRSHLISTDSNVGLLDIQMERVIRLLERTDRGHVASSAG
jgi:hypothetical protein